jgi:hypothetical protein
MKLKTYRAGVATCGYGYESESMPSVKEKVVEMELRNMLDV